MLLLPDIRAVHWQMRLGETEAASGAIVTDYEDIHQEVRTIILTPVGSVPTTPLKGCNLLPYMDLPPDVAVPQLCRSIWDAVATWVRRVDVGEVSASALGYSHWRIAVPWRVRDAVDREIRITRLALIGGGLADAS